MDTKLRELERQASTNPEAMTRYVAEMARLGYQEVCQQINHFDVSHFSGPIEDFVTELHNKIKSKDREKYHRFSISFSGSCDGYSDYGYNDSYHEDDVSIMAVIHGFRLETEKEMSQRQAREKAAEEAIKNQQRQAARHREQERKRREDAEREIYERLKRKFESEEKVERLLASIGAEAEASLRNYSEAYFKSWFYRKFKKLDGKTPIEVFDEGDLEKLRLFALKAL